MIPLRNYAEDTDCGVPQNYTLLDINENGIVQISSKHNHKVHSPEDTQEQAFIVQKGIRLTRRILTHKDVVC